MAEATGGAGGPPIIHRVIPPGFRAESFRNVDFIMDNDTNKFRYFICPIHGQLPRNTQSPVKRLPNATIMMQPGFGDDCGKVIYTHTLDYFKDKLFQTVTTRRKMFAYLLGHFGLDENRSINRVLSSYVYNVRDDTYVDKFLSLTEADTEDFWGVNEVQFDATSKKYIRLVRDDVLTNRVRKIRGAGLSISRNSELIDAINERYPCTAETGKLANIIIMITCSVAQVAGAARNTRGGAGKYYAATINNYRVALDEFGSYKKNGTATAKTVKHPPPQAPQHPSGVPYIGSLAGYHNPENLNEAGMKNVNNYIGHESPPRRTAPKPRMDTRVPAPSHGIRCVDPPREPGFCEWLSGLFSGSSATATAAATSKKNDRKRKNRTLRRRRI
jgi:hypothetical protein